MSLETLCGACGLCCDGSLFLRVPLGPREVVPEARLLVVTNDRGARHVPQRCAAFSGSGCHVYAERPFACRRYECLLRGAVRGGGLSEAAALDVIAKARALFREGAPVAEREDFLAVHFGRDP